MNTRFKTPRSWKEAEATPCIFSIEHDCGLRVKGEEPTIYVQLHEGVDNPVTGEEGGGFYVVDFRDFISQWRDLA
tara:strand:+ start:60 stop:284 length:225 start_codon:yes stop_codon:yes gene_type:complete